MAHRRAARYDTVMTIETGNGTVRIRRARADDAARIARLDIETWRDAYAGILPGPFLIDLDARRRQAGWRAEIGRPGIAVFVAVDEDDDIVAFGSAGRIRGGGRFGDVGDGRGAAAAETRDGEVFTLYVAPERHDQGIGRRLLLALLGWLRDGGTRRALVWVLRDNPARFFYQRVGGRPCGERSFAVGGAAVSAVAYAWNDIGATLREADARRTGQ
jgi:ribosomal protein S18 acetylase RimI-like enzyme